MKTITITILTILLSAFVSLYSQDTVSETKKDGIIPNTNNQTSNTKNDSSVTDTGKQDKISKDNKTTKDDTKQADENKNTSNKTKTETTDTSSKKSKEVVTTPDEKKSKQDTPDTQNDQKKKETVNQKEKDETGNNTINNKKEKTVEQKSDITKTSDPKDPNKETTQSNKKTDGTDNQKKDQDKTISTDNTQKNNDKVNATDNKDAHPNKDNTPQSKNANNEKGNTTENKDTTNNKDVNNQQKNDKNDMGNTTENKDATNNLNKEDKPKDKTAIKWEPKKDNQYLGKNNQVITPISKDDTNETTNTDYHNNFIGSSPFFGNIHTGFGLFTPVSSYSSAYGSTFGFNLQGVAERYTFLNISPVLGFSYAELTSKPRAGYVDSSMTLTGFSIGAMYQHKLALPGFLTRYSFFQKPITLYGRISDGITQVTFESDDQGPITEYINTFEFSAGFTYPVIWQAYVGIDFGYKMIFTAGDTLQGYSMGLTVGVRI